MISENKTLWVVRHGLREDNDSVKWCEMTKHMVDPDLQPLGVDMARAAAARLTGEPIDHILSSPFLRTIRTASHFAHVLKKPVKIEYGLHEMLDAKWFPHGIPRLPTPAERHEQFPEIDLDYRAQQHPLYQEMHDKEFFGRRVQAMLDNVLAHLPGTVLMVTHYAVCNCLKHCLTGTYMDGYIEMTGLFKYVFKGGAWVPEWLCDASHVTPFYPKA